MVGRNTYAPKNAVTPLGRRAAETRAATNLTDVGVRLACDVRCHPKTPAQTTSTSHSLTTARREAEDSDTSTHPGKQLEDVTEILDNRGDSSWIMIKTFNNRCPADCLCHAPLSGTSHKLITICLILAHQFIPSVVVKNKQTKTILKTWWKIPPLLSLISWMTLFVICN